MGTIRDLGEVSVERRLGEGLHGAEHHGTLGHERLGAVHDVAVLAGEWVQVLAQARRQKDSIRINLDRPIRELPLGLLADRIPDVHEELRVGGRVVLGFLDFGGHEGLCPHLVAIGHRADDELLYAEHREVVARPDALTSVHLGLQQGSLVTGRLNHGEAEERGVRSVRARAQLLARPHRVVVDGAGPRCAGRAAGSPLLVLLVALIADGVAALVRAAVEAVLPSAPLGHPAGDLLLQLVWLQLPSRGAGSEDIAAPILVVGAVQIGAFLARGPAHRSLAVFVEALLAGLGTARGCTAILAALGAGLGDPISDRSLHRVRMGRRHGQPRAAGLAVPIHGLGLRRVALLAAGAVEGVLHVALHANGGTALRTRAISVRGSTGRPHPGCDVRHAGPESLASPRCGV
mmetsp:Transcript_129932/g.417008  ORF Transcript_129932/g.417008 Transcript_129932/m.417008 type:complete len:404 (-) Transcript_129932:639-1850(-)